MINFNKKRVLKVFQVLVSDPKKVFLYFNLIRGLDFLNDKNYFKLMYWVRTGEMLDLKNPKGFNEKLLWLMIYNKNPLYSTLVDKYEVRKYIKEKVGEKYLIPLLNVFENPDEIDFEKLPNKFVLKCNHNSGEGMCICTNKSKLNYEQVKQDISKGFKKNTYNYTREWPYKNVKPLIVCEKYMENDEIIGEGVKGLIDYKFYCFNGEPKFLYVGCANFINNEKHDLLTFYDMKFRKTPFQRTDHKEFPINAEKPKCFDEMIEIATKLSENIPFVRVDLYQINGKVYFGELTFCPGSGSGLFTPKEWEEKIGDWLTVNYDILNK